MQSESELTEADAKDLAKALSTRYGPVKVISLKDNPKAVVVKTTNVVAPRLREAGDTIGVAGKKLTTVLTSGGIGKLKRRAKAGDVS